jgi:UDP-N-acetyl-D-mannosaminuronic acid transferase (WecB/TagA/CpsF family)
MEVIVMAKRIEAANAEELARKLQKIATEAEVRKMMEKIVRGKEEGASHVIFHRLMDEPLHENCEYVDSELDLNRRLDEKELRQSFRQVLVISL